ncbi:MAG TPA: hypothetical protein VMF13_20600 [Luteitalea sp.]|nr:hypothetical protein [Luteitalea sp.]
MLRGNLSTRPFYNERAVQVGLAVVTAVLAAITLFTAWQLLSLTAQQRDLAGRIARDESRANELRREATRVRGRLDPQLLNSTVLATREANQVIDARTFSWTALFNVLERTMPSEVQLLSVTPSVQNDVLTVQLLVNAKRVEPVGAFMDRLEAAGAFVDLRSVEEQTQEDGSFNVVCRGRYLGPGTRLPVEDEADDAAAAPTADRSRAGEN